jgi:hypothetical protein
MWNSNDSAIKFAKSMTSLHFELVDSKPTSMYNLCDAKPFGTNLKRSLNPMASCMETSPWMKKIKTSSISVRCFPLGWASWSAPQQSGPTNYVAPLFLSPISMDYRLDDVCSAEPYIGCPYPCPWVLGGHGWVLFPGGHGWA